MGHINSSSNSLLNGTMAMAAASSGGVMGGAMGGAMGAMGSKDKRFETVVTRHERQKQQPVKKHEHRGLSVKSAKEKGVIRTYFSKSDCVKPSRSCVSSRKKVSRNSVCVSRGGDHLIRHFNTFSLFVLYPPRNIKGKTLPKGRTCVKVKDDYDKKIEDKKRKNAVFASQRLELLDCYSSKSDCRKLVRKKGHNIGLIKNTASVASRCSSQVKHGENFEFRSNFVLKPGDRKSMIISQEHGIPDRLMTDNGTILQPSAPKKYFRRLVKDCRLFEHGGQPPISIKVIQDLETRQLHTYVYLNTQYNKFNPKSSKCRVNPVMGQVNIKCCVTDNGEMTDQTVIYLGKALNWGVNSLNYRGYTSIFNDNGTVSPGYIQAKLNNNDMVTFWLHFGNNDHPDRGGGGIYHKHGLYTHVTQEDRSYARIAYMMEPNKNHWDWAEDPLPIPKGQCMSVSNPEEKSYKVAQRILRRRKKKKEEIHASSQNKSCKKKHSCGSNKTVRNPANDKSKDRKSHKKGKNGGVNDLDRHHRKSRSKTMKDYTDYIDL